jgi:hypothetical protein
MVLLVMLKCLSSTSASPGAIPVPRQLLDKRAIIRFENNPFFLSDPVIGYETLPSKLCRIRSVRIPPVRFP